MSKRTDQHRPAEFDPTQYRVVDYLDNKRPEPPTRGDEKVWEAYRAYLARWQERIFEHFPDWKTGGGDHTSIHQCNHCGHPGIRWVAVVEHIPTGAKLAFGEICADRCELPGRDAFRAKFIKTQAQREQAHYEKLLKELAFRTENHELVDWLDSLSSDYDADTHPFLLDMKRALANYGELSEAQLAAVAKFKASADRFEEKKKADREALKDAPALETGRYEIEGTIASTKWKETGFGSQLKMVVELDNGNKVWGTVPAPIMEYAREKAGLGRVEYTGLRIRFVAEVTRSNDDEHFGFIRKPTKAAVVA